MTTSAPNLPPELLSLIFSHIPSKSALLNAALMSRKWYDSAVPHFYCHVDVGVDGANDASSSLLTVTEFFLQRPHLAGHVRHFGLRPTVTVYSLMVESTDRFHDRFDAFIERKVASCDAFEAGIMSRVQQSGGAVDFLLTLLLPRFSRLQTLDLRIPNLFPRELSRMFRGAAKWERPFTSPTWARLRSVHIYPGGYKGWEPTDFSLAALASLPSIRALHLTHLGHSDVPNEAVDEDRISNPLPLLEPGTAACISLELKNYNLLSRDIRALVSIPKHLKSFLYQQHPYHSNLSLTDVMPSLTDFHGALWTHKDTLEILDLEARRVSVQDTTIPLDADWLSFSEFTHLKTLRLSYFYLASVGDIWHDCNGVKHGRRSRTYKFISALLPLNLEYLHIYDMDIVYTAIQNHDPETSRPAAGKSSVE